MHNINICLPNRYIYISIQDFNNLIKNLFQQNKANKFIILLEIMSEFNKIIFLKNNIHKFNKVLPLCYKINLTLKNILNFSYEEEFFRLPYLHVVLQH